MGESRCSIGCADGYFPSTPPAACVDTGIPSAWQTAGYADCAAMAASFGCGFDGTVGGVAVPLGPVGTVLSDICTVTCGACPVAAAPMDDDTWCAHSIFHRANPLAFCHTGRLLRFRIPDPHCAPSAEGLCASWSEDLDTMPEHSALSGKAQPPLCRAHGRFSGLESCAESAKS